MKLRFFSAVALAVFLTPVLSVANDPLEALLKKRENAESTVTPTQPAPASPAPTPPQQNTVTDVGGYPARFGLSCEGTVRSKGSIVKTNAVEFVFRTVVNLTEQRHDVALVMTGPLFRSGGGTKQRRQRLERCELGRNRPMTDGRFPRF